MEDIDHIFTEEDYRTLTNYKAFSQFVRLAASLCSKGLGNRKRDGTKTRFLDFGTSVHTSVVPRVKTEATVK